MKQRIAVQEGQRYIQEFLQIGQNNVWEVASLTPGWMQVQHARLFNVSNPTDAKTLSCSVLNAKNGFNLLRNAIGEIKDCGV